MYYILGGLSPVSTLYSCSEISLFNHRQPKRYAYFSLENLRKTHLMVYTTMDCLNRVYGIPNVVLAVRERLSFAFYLYFWLTKNRVLDLILGSANFCRVGVVFYCFQSLKNEVLVMFSLFNNSTDL